MGAVQVAAEEHGSKTEELKQEKHETRARPNEFVRPLHQLITDISLSCIRQLKSNYKLP